MGPNLWAWLWRPSVIYSDFIHSIWWTTTLQHQIFTPKGQVSLYFEPRDTIPFHFLFLNCVGFSGISTCLFFSFWFLLSFAFIIITFSTFFPDISLYLLFYHLFPFSSSTCPFSFLPSFLALQFSPVSPGCSFILLHSKSYWTSLSCSGGLFHCFLSY